MVSQFKIFNKLPDYLQKIAYYKIFPESLIIEITKNAQSVLKLAIPFKRIDF